MKHLLVALLFISALGASAFASPTATIMTPDTIKWAPGTGPMAGTMVAVLYGDPSKAGPYIIRVKVPAGTKFGPHFHGDAENVTILEGAMLFGLGDKMDESKMKEYPTGTFVSIPKGVHHFAMAKGDAVIEISSNGPRSMTMLKHM